MYALLVALALALYSMILIDFSQVFAEFSVQADLLASTQAFYAAEGEMERTWHAVETGEISQKNILFLQESEAAPIQSEEDFLTYNQGASSYYTGKTLNSAGEDLNAASAFHPHQKDVQQGLYLAEGQTLDQLAYYGLEPRKEKTFAFREVAVEHNFNELVLAYNQNEEEEGLVVDVFQFPQEEDGINFLSLENLNFEDLEGGLESPVKRLVINTHDETQHGTPLTLGSNLLTAHFGNDDLNYNNTLNLSGFQLNNHNYLIRFQTLQNSPIHFKLSANYQGEPIPLPSMNQTLDVIGVAQPAVYQRIKMQTQVDPGLMPGLGFAVFSDGPIHK